MDNNCKHLKIKLDKTLYCKKDNKKVLISQCLKCNNKEYRTKNNKNSFYKVNNNKKKKMKYKSNKLAKLERNRKSVFTTDLDHCYLCGRKREELHEVFRGNNRLNSMKYGFVLPLCHECHSRNQNDTNFSEFWHKETQQYWEDNIGNREEFIKVFRRNYLE